MKRFLSPLAVFVILSTLCGCRNQSESDTYIFRYSNSQPVQHPRSRSMTYFKTELEKRTKGKIRVENYFSAVLGTEFEVLDMVATGALQGTRSGGFTNVNKKYNIFMLPFLVDGWNEALKLLSSDFTKKINEESKANGFHVPACGISQGFRAHTNNKRPIETPDDLAGLKMRVPPQEVYVINAQVLGVNPQELPYSEVYMALKLGVVDGQDNAVSNIWDYKVFEVQEYLTITNYATGPDPFMVNLEWYNKLPDSLKVIFDETALDAMKFSDRLNREKEAEYLILLSEKLKTNYVSLENLEKFRNATKPVYQYFIDKGYFTWDDINEARSILMK
ncbi:TRAP transporter substrate-binding protein [Bacteroidota bacterium]